MKTTISIACLAASLLALGQPAPAAGRPQSLPSHSTSLEHRHHVRQTHRPAIPYSQNTSGVIPRVIRSGNPLQMLNPLAPPRYGTAEENVLPDPDAPGKASGINLLSISF